MGVVEKSKIIVGRDIVAGDVVLGLPSSGLHTNGYTLARRVLGETREQLEAHHPSLGRTLGEALLEPHRSYYRDLKPVLPWLKGVAHITGGGIIGNVSRILPKGLAVQVESRRWTVPPIFELIQERGQHRDAGDVPRLQHGPGHDTGLRPGQRTASCKETAGGERHRRSGSPEGHRQGHHRRQRLPLRQGALESERRQRPAA